MASKGVSMIAGGDIRPMRFVKISTVANNTVLEADAGESVFGISGEGTKDPPQTGSGTNHAEAGDMATVYLPGDTCLLEVGSGGLTAGDYIKSDADGKGVAAASDGNIYGARALETASAGEFAKVYVSTGFRGA